MTSLAIGKRKRWAPGPTAKVNWSHPLAQSLLFISSGGVDWATGIMPVYTARATPGALRTGRGLTGSVSSGIRGAASWTSHPRLSALRWPYTMMSLGTITSDTSYGHFGLGCNNNSSQVTQWPFTWYTNSNGGDVRPAFGGLTSGFFLPALSLTFTTTPTMLTAVVDSTNCVTYKDAAQHDSRAHGCVGGYRTATEPYEIWGAGSDGGSYNKQAAGTIGVCAAWNRALTAHEVAQLHANPFCMLEY